nr:type IX secretion system outer membrane channel protein PorV [uncultured Carboxylicivirga sp.]
MKKNLLKIGTLLIILSLNFIFIEAQTPIQTAVPFLNINPESRSGGMGDVGAATSPDMNSQHLNPAKYAFIESSMGVSVSFTPWLRSLVNDINMYYVTYHYRMDKMQTLSASLRYFSMGQITFTGADGTDQYTGSPNEFALDAAYSRILSEKFSGAVAFRYIRSDLTNGYGDNGALSAGNAFAADVAFYFVNPMRVNRNDAEFSAGLNISNIGSKISYDKVNKEFIPTNIKLGVGFAMDMDKYNSISFALDANKLLVPSSQLSGDGEDMTGLSVPAAIFKSFGDHADGFSGELQEITVSLGAEYWYDKQFALRAGYFHENENQGNRKFASAGAGLRFNAFQLDASYIIPIVANNPLGNTMRFSLSFDLSEMNGGNKKKRR